MGLTRREFFKLGGGGIAAIAGAGILGNSLLNNTRTPLRADATDIKYKHGVCEICEMNCAFLGKIENGRLVKLEGKPKDQHSRGSLCAKGNAGINMLYDPDRLKYPMMKTVPDRIPGQDPKWKKVSWEEAINQAAEEIRKAIDKYGPQSVIWIGHNKGNDFLRAIGSPNNITHMSTCNAVRIWATNVTLGVANYVPDFENSKYILCFGWDQLGKGKNSLARGMIEGKVNNNAKVVVFDPRLSTTASKAHEWIPIRPGTDLAVVLAMLNVIISEERYNKEFVAKYVDGFEKLAEEVKKYTPEWASRISDVPADTIIRIAREFSSGCPAVIPIHKREAIQVRPGGFELVRACLAMMAITGNIERRGGALLPRIAPLNNPAPKVKPPEIEVKERVDGGHLFPLAVPAPLGGTGLYQSVPDMILKEEPYPVKVAIIYGQSLQSMPQTDKWIKALQKLDYIININIYPDDMATMADLVLPESVYLETAHISPRITNARYPQIAVGEPMIDKLYDTKEVDEIKYLLAKKLGVEQYMPALRGKALLNYRLRRYGITYDEALKKGGILNGSQKFEPRDLTSLRTESGKIQLYSSRLEEMGYHPLPWFDEKWLLHPEAKDEFYVVTSRPAVHRHAKTHNMKWLHAIMPEGFIYMNSTRAAELGIKDGDMVELTSRYGREKGRVKLIQGIRPDTICILHGFGQKSPYLKLAQNNGPNDSQIMPAYPKETNIALKDPVGASLDCHFIVKVRKV
ncbi:thiosulfate reductase / polysulfide reductase chain A [Thermosyntropha lipolytica DSM 11003]|uniref:Thiosulfate reductase / polysulfide reductase chain A n=1 Tax=Thermosyntropha lipolytica DSM 11003 TaxID=1123382 RepID=A0A1M5LLC1_9FIRM|nr:molybdopterin-dependent oxidoreductase [Thermosyntropha lipolytica]SHG65838.1 thiosulfate reductase / polysulfide reductase chain A [Thermosyntropha lipolytica DSM 11003]